jgi:hypothetical protein
MSSYDSVRSTVQVEEAQEHFAILLRFCIAIVFGAPHWLCVASTILWMDGANPRTQPKIADSYRWLAPRACIRPLPV